MLSWYCCHQLWFLGCDVMFVGYKCELSREREGELLWENGGGGELRGDENTTQLTVANETCWWIWACMRQNAEIAGHLLRKLFIVLFNCQSNCSVLSKICWVLIQMCSVLSKIFNIFTAFWPPRQQAVWMRSKVCEWLVEFLVDITCLIHSLWVTCGISSWYYYLH